MSQERVADARSPSTARLATLGFRITMRFPGIVALLLRLMMLVPARLWPRRNLLLMRGFQVGSHFARLPRDDVMWAAWCRAGAPVLAPEFVYEDDFLPDHAGETYRGMDGLRRAWTDVAEAFEEVTYDLERVVGSGDRVVSVYRVRAVARHTGIVQDYLFAYLWTFRDGRIIHCRGLGDVDEALKAVGLEN